MLRFVAAFFILLAAATMSHADEGVRVTAIESGYGQSGTQVINGLRVELDPGWHAYWKSPGEAGLPPEVSVSGTNVGSSTAYWPLPERFSSAGFESVGYRKTFVVPVITEIPDTLKPSELLFEGTIYACSDICVPVPVDLRIINEPGAKNAVTQTDLAGWLARAPGGGRSAVTPLSISRAEGGDVVASFSSAKGMREASAFLDMGMQGFGTLKSLDVASDGTATARFGITSLRDAPPELSAARIVLSDGISSPLDIPLQISADGLGMILLVALAGGLILNAMPCVFPVLAIKLLMLASIDRSRLRPTLAAMAFGVVATFLVIGGALASIKAAGHSVGWGIQFQQPVFLSFMALLLIVFGASMTGAFSILLPSSVATRLTSLTDGDGIWKSFLQGAVLTLLATPCSAPFVGTAVGYGLASGASDILPIFAAMGIGMALPFIVVAAAPRLIAVLPRPGRWMDHVKNATAAAMFATAGWLIYLLHAVGSSWLLAAVMAVSVLVLLGTAVASWRIMVVMLLAIMVAPAIFATSGLIRSDGGVRWKQFDPGSITSLVADGNVVFLDVTADWCLTCKVNERGVLSDDDVIDLLQRETVPMKGDWTRPNEEISSFLRSHGRYGIPFYLVAGPGAPDGIVLPELLTKEAITSAISRASAGHPN